MRHTIAVIGLGYVGLPIALEFAKKFKVVGFDINSDRIAQMRRHKDPSKELPPSAFERCDITFTDKVNDLQECSFYIVAVPTPIGSTNSPNLKPLISASKIVGQVLSKGDFVVYESTVYPGCTEEDCIPILEEESGLTRTVDFNFGYSPERINPGDKDRTICDIVKVVSGDTEQSSAMIEAVYKSIITAGVHVAPTVKVAEASKVIENAQRDMNIAFANQLAMIFERMDIDTQSVFEAAATKWNFSPFQPGLVGGHCIGVDPYYLIDKAQKLDLSPKLILSSRETNEEVPRFLAQKLARMLQSRDVDANGAKVLVQGVTFKENVSDIRNSKVFDLITQLKQIGFDVDAIDPHADPHEVEAEYGVKLCSLESLRDQYQGVVIAVAHDEYVSQNPLTFEKLVAQNGAIMDIKGICHNAHILAGCEYWRM